jgi:hypothetical protein
MGGNVRPLVGLLLAMLSPVMAWADVAGIWEGTLGFSTRTLRIVLHISGPDSNLTATDDSPDQDVFGHRVDAISMTGPTLQFTLKGLGVQFTGDLMADGSINGTFVQRGVGIPLVLKRSEGVTPPPATGSVSDGRYHNDRTGIEFDLPEGFSVTSTDNYINPNGVINTNGVQAMIQVSFPHGQTMIGVWMSKRRVQPENLPKIIDRQIPAKIARRKSPDNNYRISQESIQKVQIGGQQAIRATAYLQEGGSQQAELLTWIATEHSIVHFYSFVPVDALPDFKWRFDQMVQTARVP